jgi:hypothetical protein
MATEIITNINSVLTQRGLRDNVNFVQSEVIPAYYQFSFSSVSNLNIGDKIFVIYTSVNYIETEIVDITGLNVTINTILFILYPPTFTRNIVLPPTADSVDLNVNVVAAFNPVVIEMQRQDYKDNTLRSTWNNIYVSIPCGYTFDGETVIYDGFEVGAVIQVITESGFAEYFTILNISTSGGTVYATFDKIWSLFNPFFLAIINFTSRLNFYVTLLITDNSFNPKSVELRFTPDSKGFMRAEISGALRSLLNLNFTENVINPNSVRTDETNLFSPFYFGTEDHWIGSNEGYIKYFGAEDVKYCIAGAFQIGDPGNGYYNKYFANNETSFVYPELMPHWVTQFENPVFFAGFPFTLSFVANQTINAGFEDYFFRYTIQVTNGNLDTYDSDPFIFYDFINLTRINIPEALTTHLAGIATYGKKVTIRFGRMESFGFLDCLAPITLNVKRPIEQSCNTFYVRWLNTLGGWDYWLFEHKIYEGFKVENGNNYESYFDNISGISDFENVTFKNVSPAVQVGSNTLTRNEAEGLKILATSPKVYWYNEEISKWIGVIVEPGTFQLRSTNEEYFNIELTIVKPKYFNQFA